MSATNVSEPGSVVTIRYIDPRTVSDRQQLATWRSWLDRQEQARMGRFLQAKHQHDFLVSHALRRSVVARALGCAPQTLVFGTTGRDKPVLAHPGGPQALHFNLAHTEGLAVVAVSDAPVGVDVECLERAVAGADLARRYFTEREYADIARQPAKTQRQRFLTYWTLKEAFLKAQAWGIVDDLGGFEFEISAAPDSNRIRLRVHQARLSPTEPWRFHHWQPTVAHLMSLAYSARLAAPVAIDCQPWDGRSNVTARACPSHQLLSE